MFNEMDSMVTHWNNHITVNAIKGIITNLYQIYKINWGKSNKALTAGSSEKIIENLKLFKVLSLEIKTRCFSLKMEKLSYNYISMLKI